jgi:hypothetical protein
MNSLKMGRRILFLTVTVITVLATASFASAQGLRKMAAAPDEAVMLAPEAVYNYNALTLVLDGTGITMADELATYVGGTFEVLKWDAGTQQWAVRRPTQPWIGPDFPLAVGNPYFVAVDSTAVSPVTFVGDVPPQESVVFTLLPGTSPNLADWKYNFISLPLDRSDITTADGLAADIGGVYEVLKWDASLQQWAVRRPTQPWIGPDFDVYIGYPYMVRLDDTAPTSWPTY